MSISYLDGLSVLQLVVFIPCLVIALFLWRRDGFRPGSASWRFASTLSILRVTGSICTLIAISHPSSSLETAIIVSKVVGIPPLSLCCITMADRINSHMNIVPKIVFLFIMVVAITGLVLGIYGADKSLDDTSSGFTLDVYIKAAIAMYLFLYASLISLVVIFASKWKQYHNSSDKRVVLAMALATPFIGVKHIYAAIGDYGHVKGFGILTGNTTAYLLMDVLMEMIAIIIILGFGLTFATASTPEHTHELDQGESEHQDEVKTSNTSSSGV